MNKIVMTKYGFVRSPEDDFTDDGTRFTCYRAGNVVVSKTTWQGEAFISGRLEKYTLPYETYSKLPHYKDLDKLNGKYIDTITDQDLIDLYNACIAYDKEYTDAEAAIVYPTMDELVEQCKKVIAHYKEEKEEAMDLITKAANNLILYASEYELKSIKNDIGVLDARIKYYDPTTYPQSIYKLASSFDFIDPANYNLQESWHLKQIKEIVEKYC